jgi:ABC-type multidrug transport system ATPase subunit
MKYPGNIISLLSVGGGSMLQRHTGYLPGEISFIDGMTGAGFLQFMASMQGVKDKAKREKHISTQNLEDIFMDYYDREAKVQ